MPTIKLRCPNDWTAWNKQFLHKVRKADLWKQVVPSEGRLPELEDPKLGRFPHVTREIISRRPDGTPTQVRQSMDAAGSFDDPHVMIEWHEAFLCFGPFEKQSYCVERIKKWVADTVDPSYFRTCCQSESSLGDWYHNLKDQLNQPSGNTDDSPRTGQEEA